MMETTAVTPAKPKTYDDLIKAKQTEMNELGKLLALHLASIRDIVNAHFAANDGCTKCGGRGWVVVWDTMDSMSGCYAEYGGCPDEKCTEETRAKSGTIVYNHHSKYDNLRGVADPITAHPLHKIMCVPVMNDFKALANEVEELRRMGAVKKGSKVVVIKGRKLPVGTLAVAAYVNADSALLKDESKWQDRNANGIWVPLQNLAVLA